MNFNFPKHDPAHENIKMNVGYEKQSANVPDHPMTVNCSLCFLKKKKIKKNPCVLELAFCKFGS